MPDHCPGYCHNYLHSAEAVRQRESAEIQQLLTERFEQPDLWANTPKCQFTRPLAIDQVNADKAQSDFIMNAEPVGDFEGEYDV